ncbi:5-methylcytosine restriction system specificity protein McrC [Bradyrhizobium sp. PMVTL-01]|uniref:5-methylcytosine restriction system specificity protein McrC n=1 Tax=Bradyrhizobium sp. PMVTL-01 TaxID=3434999 RepID=UPI003F70CE97
MSAIPIQNIYYLLCYAWDALDQGELVDVSEVRSTELVDLFAFVLLEGVRHLSRMGLERGYCETSEEMYGIRGRLDVAASLRRPIFMLGRAHCTYDELTANTLANRIIKATLTNLERDQSLNTDLRDRIHGVVRQLPEINSIHLSNTLFRKVSVTSNRRFYRFLLDICELVHNSSLPEPAGSRKFRDFTRDDKKMWRLFQAFLLNFIRRECQPWSARSEEVAWRANSETDPSLNLLPRMVTDISAWRPGEYRIIDAKFYTETLSRNFGARKLHSENLYQLMAYVMNAKPKHGVAPDGVLVYPRVTEKLREEYNILGRKFSVFTVDLAAPWQSIDRDIRELFR